MRNIALLHSDISKGMKSYGPKALVPINREKTPLIIEQLRCIRKSYKREKYVVYLILGFEYDRIIQTLKDYNEYKNVEIIFHSDYSKDNQGPGFIKAISEIQNNDLLIIQNGILLYDMYFDTRYSQIPLCKKTKIKKFDIGARIDSGSVSYLFYDLEYEWPELCYMDHDTYNSARSIVLGSSLNKDYCFTFEHINHLIDNDFKFYIKFLKKQQIKKVVNHKKIC